VARRAAGSKGVDVVVNHEDVPQIGLDLKTGRGWTPAQLKEIKKRFAIPIEEIVVK
jgi:hypothetical protein